MSTLILTTANNLSVYQRMLAAKSSERTQQAYADDLRQFAEFMGGLTLSDIPNEPDTWRQLVTQES